MDAGGQIREGVHRFAQLIAGRADGAAARRALALAEALQATQMPAESPAADIHHRFVVRLVAFAAQVRPEEILSRGRGTTEASSARQLAMYLLHTKLSLPFAVVAKLFGRDRTTVAHACSAVEDLRDIPERDDFVGELESMLELAVSMTSYAAAKSANGHRQ
jgi:chromosomal replication initiation ATPase DnaA